MRARFALCGLVLCLFGAGCSLVENTSRLTAYCVAQSLDDCQERRRNRRWAEQAWDRLRKTTPDGLYSEDFAEGFKEGFADFLYRGGDGEPPFLPPIKYRAMRYQTPQGYQAVENWFTGFRDGSAQARQGGYRQWITGPSSLQSATPVLQPPGHEEGLPALPQPTEEKPPPPGSARRSDERPSTLIRAAELTDVRAGPARRNDERPSTAPAAPPKSPAPAQIQAQFRPELNEWQLVSTNPDGSGVHTAFMSRHSYSEMMQRVRRQQEENRAVGGRHGITEDEGTSATALEVDDATYEDLTAFLMWYYESPEE